MTASAPKKSITPSLVAYHAMPAPKGQAPVMTPIGVAFSHPDGEGFTLQLNLIPANGGSIVLRKAKVKKAN